MKRLAWLAVLFLFACTPSRAELIGHWKFDDCTTTDASATASHLTSHNGPTCVPGRFREAWQFNGVDQYLERGFDPNFVPGDRPWTVAAWAKSDLSSNYQVLVSWYRCGANPGCGGLDNSLYELGLNQGRPYWFVRDDESAVHSLEDAASIADGDWHLIVGTMNPAADSVKLYVDGALRGVSAGPLASLVSGPVAIPLEIGRQYRSWGPPIAYHAGAIDEVRIYDQELTASEIAQLFVSTTAVGQGSEAATFSIEGQNPAHGGRLRVAFTLPGDGDTEVVAFDLSGRRVARSAALRVAGRHSVDLAAGRSLRPGLYLVRVSQGTRSSTRTLAVLD